ncbi:MAG: flagellar export protein FliJ [Planctomycetota bacterium]|jgi:flagellar export protein FliJ
MKPFPLEKVLEVRRHTRLERRNALGAAIADEQALLDMRQQIDQQKNDLLDELSNLSQSAALNVEAAARRRYFAGQLEIQLLLIDQQIFEARQAVDTARAALVKADQDVKVLERLREQHITEETYQANRRNEIALAEQWQSANWNW